MKKNIFSNKYLTKIIYYGLLSMRLLFIILNQKLGNMDEIWNFVFANNIHNGLIPYKDFNLISTPLSCFINNLILFIDSSLIAFRIMYFIYYLIIIYLLNKILNKLNIITIIKYLITFLLTIILVKSCYLDYNFIQIILILLLINLHLKNPHYENSKLNIIIPLISGLTIINKQSSGLIIVSINLILILLNKFYFKKKINITFILKQIIIMLIPTIIFILYLIITDSLMAFYDMAILGLSAFTNKYLSTIFLVELLIIYLFIIPEMYLNKSKITSWILFLYSLASISFVIPILDKVHAAYAIIIPLIFLTFIINNKIKKLKINDLYAYLLFPILIILISTNISKYTTAIKTNDGIYKYIPTNSREQEIIKEINDYEISKSKDYDIYILDISASLFHLNINTYHKYFDMFMNGNFGINGEKEIYDIIDSDNKIFMINNMSNHWQTPKNIVNYVKEKYQICGAIDYLTIYCQK